MGLLSWLEAPHWEAQGGWRAFFTHEVMWNRSFWSFAKEDDEGDIFLDSNREDSCDQMSTSEILEGCSLRQPPHDTHPAAVAPRSDVEGVASGPAGP